MAKCDTMKSLSCLICIILELWIFSADARVDMTFFSGPARITETTTSQGIVIYCLDAKDADGDIVQEFGRVIDTGTGATGTGASGPSDYVGGSASPVPVGPDSGLPEGSFIQNNVNFLGHIFFMPEIDDILVERVGVFYCDTNTTGEGDDSTRIQHILLAENAVIKPLKGTVTIMPGETATLEVETTSGSSSGLKWLRDGGITLLSSCDDQSSCDVSAAGIYECYYEGERDLGLHGIMRVIVRGCPAEMWDPASNCGKVCVECINGGVCDDQVGDCICPPGFHGTHCEQTCGFNAVGPTCGIGCSDANGCIDRYLCLPDPYGCSCTAGYQGFSCETACDSNHFGADCALDCHCATDGCNQYTGVCDSEGCVTGWSGDNCQYNSSEVISFTNMKVNPNEQTTFTCVIKAYPRPVESQIVMARTSSSSSNISFVYAIDPGYWQVIVTSSSVTVNSGEEFSCSVIIGAVAGTTSETITVDVFVLPMLTSAPYANDSSIGPTYVLVTWREWHNGTDIGDGPITKYELYYGIQGEATINFTKAYEVFVNSSLVETTNSNLFNPSLDEYLYYFNVSKLNPDTEYTFTIKTYRQGKNGGGDFSPFFNASTKCAVPATVTDISVDEIFATSIKLSWAEPETGSLCSMPLTYTVTYTLVNKDQCETTVDKHEPITTQNQTLVLGDLIPHSTYDITITSNTKGGKSQPYEFSEVTSSSEPGVVTNLSLINASQTHLAFFWDEPACGQKNGDHLSYIYNLTTLDVEGDSEFGETKETTQSFYDLLDGTKYTFKVKCQTEVGLYGNESRLLISTTDSPTTTSGVTNVGAIVGGVFGAVFFSLVLIIIVFFYLQRNKHKAENVHQAAPPIIFSNLSHEEHLPSDKHAKNTNNISEHETAALREDVKDKEKNKGKPFNYENVNVSSPMTLEIFVEHVIKSRNNNQLIEEFQHLPPGQTSNWNIAQDPKNKAKNRYGNIIPYDHSRVVLDTEDDDSKSDYINASFIDGFLKKGAYIAAQGPNKSSVNDMWRMIWQENVSTIMMATKCVEMGKIKCEYYWPLSGKKIYGNYFVTLENKEETDEYVLHTLKLCKSDEETRIVQHFQFLVWPDMGVPVSTSSTLKFLKKVKDAHVKDKGPLLIHCSAGVGRTGTFIAMDIMLDMMKAKGELDVFTCVKEMRKDRISMIQTQGQYLFLHDALLEEILSGDTTIPVSNFEYYLNNLQMSNGFSEEFRKLELLSHTPNIKRDCELGSLPENLGKNRYPNLISIDRTCPRLETIAKGSTDFIHANIVEKFLVTQMPLPHTMSDFWSLVYDYNSSTIVMLNYLNDADNQGQYWPDDGQAEYGPFTVELESETMWGSITLRSLNLWKTNDSNSVRSIQQFQVSDWPAGNVVPAGGVLTELLSAVDRWQQQSGDGPVTIHCIDGLGRSGIYCTVALSVDQIKANQSVDVFDAVKTIRISRPGMIKSKDEYFSCYKNLLDYIESFETYANFK